jgi:CDP-diacylglycerol--glycerol-3-phosphate 3-phosphatidyltransferase
MITDIISKERVRSLFLPVTKRLAATGISPNALTVIGFGLVLGSAAVLAAGYRQLGGVLFLLTTGFDLFDGAVAELINRKTKFGAFLDSNLDRFAEIAIYLAILFPYATAGKTLEVVLCYLAVTGSLMVSYARARAEGLGLSGEVGLFQRPERVILLGIGLILDLVVPVLVILAVLSYLTSLQRMAHVWRLTGGK